MMQLVDFWSTKYVLWTLLLFIVAERLFSRNSSGPGTDFKVIQEKGEGDDGVWRGC